MVIGCYLISVITITCIIILLWSLPGDYEARSDYLIQCCCFLSSLDLKTQWGGSVSGANYSPHFSVTYGTTEHVYH